MSKAQWPKIFKAWAGIEPAYKGFADPCLTTWLPGRYSKILALNMCCSKAEVVELADTLALGASAARHEGSNPSLGINLMLGAQGFTIK